MATSTENRPSGDSANRFETLILGAGISGLTLAWRLQQRGERSFALLERSSRVGGWIQSHLEEGFLFERGPRSCRAAGAGGATLELVHELGLEGELIWADKSAKVRYLLEKGKLRPLPYKPHHLFTNPFGRMVAKALTCEWRRPPRPAEDESILDFATRRFNQEVAHRLFDPLVAGIFAGEIDQLSIRACFPTLDRWEQEEGSILKGMVRSRSKGRRGLFSFRDGMETLPRALQGALNCPIQLNTEITQIAFDKGEMVLSLPGQTLRCQRLLSTLSPYFLLPLLETSAPELKPLLEQTPSLSLGVVHLGYHRKLLDRPGFGYLISRAEEEEILGCVWDSSVFPQQNSSGQETRLTVMIAGEGRPFGQIAQRALRRHLGIYDTPDCLAIFPAQHAIPQYRVGHLSRFAQIEALLEERYPQLSFFGSGFYGASVNECISRASNYSIFN